MKEKKTRYRNSLHSKYLSGKICFVLCEKNLLSYTSDAGGDTKASVINVTSPKTYNPIPPKKGPSFSYDMKFTQYKLLLDTP